MVEFWAPWAKQCLLADPLLEEAARDLQEHARLVRLNVEENPMAATVYGVRNIPLVILFRRGEELDHWSGSLAKEEIVERVRAACGGGAPATDSETGR